MHVKCFQRHLCQGMLKEVSVMAMTLMVLMMVVIDTIPS